MLKISLVTPMLTKLLQLTKRDQGGEPLDDSLRHRSAFQYSDDADATAAFAPEGNTDSVVFQGVKMPTKKLRRPTSQHIIYFVYVASACAFLAILLSPFTRAVEHIQNAKQLQSQLDEQIARSRERKLRRALIGGGDGLGIHGQTQHLPGSSDSWFFTYSRGPDGVKVWSSDGNGTMTPNERSRDINQIVDALLGMQKLFEHDPFFSDPFDTLLMPTLPPFRSFASLPQAHSHHPIALPATDNSVSGINWESEAEDVNGNFAFPHRMRRMVDALHEYDDMFSSELLRQPFAIPFFR